MSSAGPRGWPEAQKIVSSTPQRSLLPPSQHRQTLEDHQCECRRRAESGSLHERSQRRDEYVSAIRVARGRETPPRLPLILSPVVRRTDRGRHRKPGISSAEQATERLSSSTTAWPRRLSRHYSKSSGDDRHSNRASCSLEEMAGRRRSPPESSARQR